MRHFGQIGIALGALGIVIALMGLFPGVTGIEETLGIGIVQVFMLVSGYGMLVIGAIIYLKYTFYFGIPSTLAQQIGVRLTLTGLLFASLVGLADILGFGSHLRTETGDIFLGQLQAFGLLGNLILSSVGVVIYALAGLSEIEADDPDAEAESQAPAESALNSQPPSRTEPDQAPVA